MEPKSTGSSKSPADASAPDAFSDGRPSLAVETGPAPGPIAGDADTALEQFLIDRELVTEEQLDRMRRIRSRLTEHKPVTQLVVELGFLSRPRLEAALRDRQRTLPVEDLLVEQGKLDAAKLAEARAALGGETAGLGRKLIDMGAVDEREYLEAYCQRHDLPFVSPDPSLLDPLLLRQVSHKYLVRHRLLPLSIEEGRLSVLTDEPDPPAALAEMERLYSVPVGIAITTRPQLDALFTLVERGPESLERTTEEEAIDYHRIEDGIDSDRASDIVDHIILRALRQGASDIHIEPMQSKLRVRFRVDGSLVQVSDYPRSYTARIISRVKVLAQADLAEHRRHQDGKIHIRFGDEQVDLRASIYVTVFGENVVMRVLRRNRGLVGLEDMGFSPVMLQRFVDDVLEPSTGIVLVTGPTGSGKTTTLYAAVDRINDSSKKIITCEDPVEYVIESITQCSVVNRPGMNFVDSLKAIVRQDPDVILVGEIRDHESADMAIQSALTGHKVLSTFHTEDAVGALVRLTEMGIETFMIASTVTGVLAQRLVRRQCAHCKVETTATPQEMRSLSLNPEELSAYTLTKGRGCPECFHTGYKGRLGVHELLVMSDPLREAVMQRKPAHELRRVAAEQPGFVLLQEDGVAKALRGLTTLSEVIENSPRSSRVRPLGRLLEMYE